MATHSKEQLKKYVELVVALRAKAKNISQMEALRQIRDEVRAMKSNKESQTVRSKKEHCFNNPEVRERMTQFHQKMEKESEERRKRRAAGLNPYLTTEE